MRSRIERGGGVSERGDLGVASLGVHGSGKQHISIRASVSPLGMGKCAARGGCGSLRGIGGEGNEPISEIPA